VVAVGVVVAPEAAVVAAEEVGVVAAEEVAVAVAAVEAAEADSLRALGPVAGSSR
jgi:hypothetical protein